MSYNIEQVNSGFMSFTAAGLAEGTNANTYKTVNTLTYTSDGVLKSKGATDNIAMTSTAGTVPPSSAALYAVWIDSAGTFSNSRGPVVTSGDPCPMPTAPANNLTLVGLIKVTTNSSTTFTPGSTDLGNAGVTDLYYDCSVMPGAAI
jgi:hypothetical protein